MRPASWFAVRAAYLIALYSLTGAMLGDVVWRTLDRWAEVSGDWDTWFPWRDRFATVCLVSDLLRVPAMAAFFAALESRLRADGLRAARWSPRAHFLGWFVPVANLLVPFLAVRELWFRLWRGGGARGLPIVLAAWWGAHLASRPLFFLVAVAPEEGLTPAGIWRVLLLGGEHAGALEGLRFAGWATTGVVLFRFGTSRVATRPGVFD
ncbi:MAG: DUF4328 domain-containing protein [Planctomycetota bacterium]